MLFGPLVMAAVVCSYSYFAVCLFVDILLLSFVGLGKRMDIYIYIYI